MSLPSAAPNRSIRLVSSAAFAVALLLAVCAHADDARERAAKDFDEAVKLYERAAYAEAARAFLRADSESPSADALSNALAAARRANDHLLVVDVARRALVQESAEPALAVKARQALADAAGHLAQIDVACEPSPCSLDLDGATQALGRRYVLPGTHAFHASGADGAIADESLELVAGATYRVVLHPSKPGETVRPSEVKRDTPTERPAPEPRPPPPVERAESAGESRPLPPGVFYAGVGLSVALVGLTTWSGFDTLAAKRDLPNSPTTHQVDDVRSKAHRTDFLLAGSVVVAAATAYAGFELVSFGTPRKGARLDVTPASLVLGGWF